MGESAGYSGTPLFKKMGIREGSRVGLAGAPEGFEAALEPLPAGARVVRRIGSHQDVIVLFVRRKAELDRRFSQLARRLDPDGGLWVAWPKKASGVATDLAFEPVQRVGLDAGLVDNKVCAVDESWSGLRFVHRLADRPKRR